MATRDSRATMEKLLAAEMERMRVEEAEEEAAGETQAPHRRLEPN
jgi:hypothetical protein